MFFQEPSLLKGQWKLIGEDAEGDPVLSVSSESPEWVMTDVLLKPKAVPLNSHVSPSAGLWLLRSHCAGESIAQCSVTPGRGLQHRARLPQLKNVNLKSLTQQKSRSMMASFPNKAHFLG